MGLDMYLDKIPKSIIEYKDVVLDEIKETNPELYQKLQPYADSYGSLYHDVLYWRKANQIHNWFVNNVQDGVDDCARYEVSKEQLEELRDICKEVLEKAVTMAAPVKNGEQIFPTRKTLYEPGEKIINSEVCEKLLPTTSGFFFGGTDYDNYYLEDVKYSYEELSKVIAETDFDKEAIFYTSSW